MVNDFMKFVYALFVLAAAASTPAETTYLGLYIQNKKIGYASYDSLPVRFQGKSAVKSTSRTVMDTSLLGTSMLIQMDSTSWSTPKGAPLRMWSDTKSGGRSNRVDAIFQSKNVQLTIENGGIKSKRLLPIPSGGQVVDDPLTVVLQKGIKPGGSKSFYVLDPSTAAFIKNLVQIVGPRTTIVRGKKVKATLIEVTDPRSNMKIYVGTKGELVRVEGPAGIEMIPVSKRVALSKNSAYEPSTDLAFSTSIQPDKPLDDPSHLTGLKLRISGKNLSNIPNDTFQTVSKEKDAWIVDIHPINIKKEAPCSINVAAKQKPDWLKPSLNIPSDNPRFKSLAKSLISSRNDVQSATFAIQKYVYDVMKPNAGIGVLRDATEVLDSKEGVCRDYATLTVTLLRAAGIPARLASGLVNWDGTFYYHAWAEAWDGSKWIGVDSTTDQFQLSAGHVKLGDGNVDTAFSFTFLEKAKIDVLGSRKD